MVYVNLIIYYCISCVKNLSGALFLYSDNGFPTFLLVKCRDVLCVQGKIIII